MPHTALIASANSRLHADVMLIRLRRSGIACNQISTWFPQHHMPNAAACWLPVGRAHHVQIGGKTVVMAGPLHQRVSSCKDAKSVIALLMASGLDRATAESVEEKIEQGHILIFVDAHNADEAAVTQQVYARSSAEFVATSAPRSASTERTAASTPVAPAIAA